MNFKKIFNLISNKKNDSLYLDNNKSYKNLINVACILDIFSYQCFKYECNLIPLSPDDWKQTIIKEEPLILLVESYWLANNGQWDITKVKQQKQIKLLVEFCKSLNIKTVFWNKEDPYSFDMYLNLAKEFEIIYTTDIACIKRYKSIVNHENVYLLPFAAQPAIHNPIEIYDNRSDKISFAGSYYGATFIERQHQFEIIASICNEYGLDIYDRHFGTTNPLRMFPQKYKDNIIGNLKGEEIVKAYKGYKFGINLNSIKGSYTMFARRVIELMASNTVVISSPSIGMEEFFGDLTIHDTDNIKSSIDKLKEDEIYYKKYRLLALRRVLKDHTYEDRIKDIVEKSLNIKLSNKFKTVAVVAFVENEEEIKKIEYMFNNQLYINKNLYIICRFNVNKSKKPNIYDIKSIEYKKVQDLIKEEYISYINTKDFYGPYYLTDLMYATLYAPQCEAIGKSSYYFLEDKLKFKSNKQEYKYVNELMYRNSIVKLCVINNRVGDLFNLFNNVTIRYNHMLSIDCFNYLYNENDKPIDEKSLNKILDIKNINIGKNINEIQKDYYRNIIEDEKTYKLDLSKFICKNIDINLKKFKESGLIINSNLDQSKHQYIIYNLQTDNISNIPKFSTIKVSFNKEYTITVLGDNDDNQNSAIFITAYSDKKMEKSYVIQLNSSKVLSFSKKIKKILVAVRIQGSGTVIIDDIIIRESRKNYIEEGRGDYLILTDNYPSDLEIYKNGFVHRRVKNYIKNGLSVDIFVFNPHEQNNYLQYEYDGVIVRRGGKEHLAQLLENSTYKKILVHFLREDMYNVISLFNNIETIVWIHGAEVRPWYRRYFEYEDSVNLKDIILNSDRKMNFIRKLFTKIPLNMHLVFVSENLKNEVEKDIGIKIDESKYSIIHNIIDESLFLYNSKTKDQRKKILSIRPYDSQIYANDLSVKAIFELSKKTYFNELEFCFYGRGKLFEQILNPLRIFDNVKIHETFLKQEEIANIHKEYGVFLVPTRGDTQGVSRDEAMSSGLVPITNDVGAIREFVNEECSMIAPKESYIQIANAIEYLYLNPDEFIKKSINATKQVKNLSSTSHTILKEIELIQKPVNNQFKEKYKLDLQNLICIPNHKLDITKNDDGSVKVKSIIPENKHQYIYYNINVKDNDVVNFNAPPQYSPILIESNKEYLFESFGSKAVYTSIVIIAYSKNKKEKHYFIPLNSHKIIKFDLNIEKIMICIRVVGNQEFSIKDITIKERKKEIQSLKEYKVNNIPYISILMTSYNVEKYIEQAINSIINQSIGFQNIEIIIIDDASTDKTTQIIKRYMNKYSQISLIINPQNEKYPGKSKNKALNLARGKYIMLVDSDDILSIQACINLYNLMEIYKSDYIIGKYSYLYDKDNRVEAEPLFETKKYKRSYINFNLNYLYNNSLEQHITSCDIINQPGTSCNKIYKTSFLNNNNVRYVEDQIIGEDYIFNHQCLLKASKISYFPINIFEYRKRNTIFNRSITQEFNTQRMDDLLKQKLRTSQLYKSTPYPFDKITNSYFLNSIYPRIIDIENYTDKEKILEKIKEFLNYFDLNDPRINENRKNVLQNVLKNDMSHFNTFIEEGFSVISPTIRKNCIDNIIRNFINQDYSKKELIIVVNKDNINIEYIQEKIKKYINIRVYKLPESYTLGECLNFGVEKSKYKFIAKFDDDDHYSKYYLSEVYNNLKKTKCDIIGKSKIYYYLDEFKELRILKDGVVNKDIKKVAGATICFKKEVFDQVKFYNININEDGVFLAECIKKGFNIYATSSKNFIAFRSNSLDNHTWKIELEKILDMTIPYKNNISFEQCFNLVELKSTESGY
ncbi:glycosyltransferase [Romboutsia lituseburensis]|uniref:glycosyltransferase n=1 Tax=Romboutsia lituseburensis TaxID=1537 RepID=UPI00215A9FFB|nr:glycosyltransferase [Romboutsia lituseburensis]MCR8744697.1 glycosyltransferase [Romboutsia lituseburensis]